MNNKYAQVALTYVQSWVVLVGVAAGVLWGSILLIGTLTHTLVLTTPFPALGTVVMFAWAVGLQSRLNFSGPRQHLLPGFRGPHLLAPAVLIVAGSLILALVLPVSGPRSFLGTLACVGLTFALMVWCVCRAWAVVLGWVMLAGWSGLSMLADKPLGYSNLNSIITGDRPMAALEMLAICAIVLLEAARELSCGREVSPFWDYLAATDETIRSLFWRESESPPRPRDNDPIEWLTLRLRDWRTDGMLARLKSRRWPKLMRWQLPSEGRGPMWLVVLCYGPFLGATWWLCTAPQLEKARSDLLGRLALVMAIAIWSMVILDWSMRRRALDQDLLRPVSRRQMFREMWWAILLDFGIIHLVLLAQWFFLLWVLVGGEPLRHADIWASMAGYLGWAIAILCSELWLLRYCIKQLYSIIIWICAVFPVCMAGLSLILSTAATARVEIGVALIAASAVILWDAKRRWMAVDIN